MKSTVILWLFAQIYYGLFQFGISVVPFDVHTNDDVHNILSVWIRAIFWKRRELCSVRHYIILSILNFFHECTFWLIYNQCLIFFLQIWSTLVQWIQTIKRRISKKLNRPPSDSLSSRTAVHHQIVLQSVRSIQILSNCSI